MSIVTQQEGENIIEHELERMAEAVYSGEQADDETNRRQCYLEISDASPEQLLGIKRRLENKLKEDIRKLVDTVFPGKGTNEEILRQEYKEQIDRGSFSELKEIKCFLVGAKEVNRSNEKNMDPAN